jgi:hypothetical protein
LGSIIRADFIAGLAQALGKLLFKSWIQSDGLQRSVFRLESKSGEVRPFLDGKNDQYNQQGNGDADGQENVQEDRGNGKNHQQDCSKQSRGQQKVTVPEQTSQTGIRFFHD